MGQVSGGIQLGKLCFVTADDSLHPTSDDIRLIVRLCDQPFKFRGTNYIKLGDLWTGRSKRSIRLDDASAHLICVLEVELIQTRDFIGMPFHAGCLLT